MKIKLFGKNSNEIAGLVKGLGFEIIEKDPDAIISYGGDGTLLSSEREYPGIPKLPIRNSKFCNKCPNHEDEKLLQAFLENKLNLKEYKKLHTKIYGTDLYALNDFVVRNEHPIHAIRFDATVNGIPQDFYIGDGIVVATPFGSTGYFKSVTGKSFDKGFGLALNNVTEKAKPIYLGGKDTVGFQLKRGKAMLSFDNSHETFHISERIKLTFKLSDKLAKIYEAESLRCPTCKVKRD